MESNAQKAIMRPNNISALVIIVLLVVFGLVWHEQLAIYDWWRLAGYHPPQQVVTLADETTMTAYGRHLFYVYHPQLEGSTQFNRDCSVTPQVIVLGCTVSFQGIYLYDVQDSELNGLEQTTAAYEMLHVGYSRLSSSERQRIDALVMQAYTAAAASNPQLVQEEASYLKTEGASAVPNELHSMVGTEVANLPPALEAYYKQYFSNRQAILTYKNEYESAFVQRQETVADDDQELSEWKADIANDESQITMQNQRLSAQYSQLKGLIAENQDAQYNAGVDGYNAAVASVSDLVTRTQRLIAAYNQLVAERNDVALQVDKLDQTISSEPLAGSATTLGSQ
ncbi:MAG TPA: hypothetical protein VMS08_05900 [Candidatus Saccharimonadia bacterium]|nr:hypothetical protein [Candidatus Saccharimonadia bacterium]